MVVGTMEKELTIADVAKRLGVSYQTARKRILIEKRIRYRREGLEYRVRESDLEAYLQSTYENHGEEEKK